VRRAVCSTHQGLVNAVATVPSRRHPSTVLSHTIHN